MIARSTICALLPLVSSGLAQSSDADPYRYVMDDALVVIAMDGPGLLAERLAGTSLARLAGHEVVVEMIEAGTAEFQREMRESETDRAALDLFTECFATLQDYRGRIVLALLAVDGSPSTCLSLHLTDDGVTDLESIHAAYRRAVDQWGFVIGEHELAGRRVWYIDEEEDRSDVSFMHDGSLTLLVHPNDALHFATTVIERAGAYEPSGSARAAPLSLEIDLAGVWRAASPAAHENVQVHRLGVVSRTLASIGFPALGSLDVALEPVGERVSITAEVEHEVDEHQRLAWRRSNDDGLAKLLALVPTDWGCWWAGSVHLGGAIDFVDAYAKSAGGHVASIDGRLRAASDALGVDIRRDLIATQNGALLVMSDFGAGEMVVGGDFDEDDWSLGLVSRLDDAGRFTEALERVMRSRGLHAARSSEQYRGFDVFSMRIDRGVSYAITPRELVIGFGQRGGDCVRAVLDRVHDRERGVDDELPAAIDWFGESLGDWDSFGAIAFERDLRELQVFWEGFDRGAGNPEVSRVARAVAGCLVDLDLLRWTSASRYGERGVRMRWVW